MLPKQQVWWENRDRQTLREETYKHQGLEDNTLANMFASAGKWRLKLSWNNLDYLRTLLLDPQTFAFVQFCLIDHSALLNRNYREQVSRLAVSASSLSWLVTDCLCCGLSLPGRQECPSFRHHYIPTRRSQLPGLILLAFCTLPFTVIFLTPAIEPANNLRLSSDLSFCFFSRELKD